VSSSSVKIEFSRLGFFLQKTHCNDNDAMTHLFSKTTTSQTLSHNDATCLTHSKVKGVVNQSFGAAVHNSVYTQVFESNMARQSVTTGS